MEWERMGVTGLRGSRRGRGVDVSRLLAEGLSKLGWAGTYKWWKKEGGQYVRYNP